MRAIGLLRASAFLAAALLASGVACTLGEEIVHAYPIAGLDGVITRSGVEFDPKTTSDGNGSLRLSSKGYTAFRLFEIEDPDVEGTKLLYRARIRTQNVEGRVYLEMWCRFPGRGEFFSRALETSITGTTEWTSQETPFVLEDGQNPSNIKLNLIVEGPGAVWVDEIVLAKGAS
jgi:hypothetical protein